MDATVIDRLDDLACEGLLGPVVFLPRADVARMRMEIEQFGLPESTIGHGLVFEGRPVLIAPDVEAMP